MRLYTYRQKTLLLFLTFTSVTILSFVVAYVYISAKNRVQSAQSLVDGIHVLILNQNNTISDFLLYDLSDTLFYRNKYSDKTLKKRELYLNFKAISYQFKQNGIFENGQFDAYLSALDSINEHQNTIFDSIVSLSLKRGFIDFGIEGEMRKAIHKAEQNTSVNQEVLLTIRRHEKDFIIRKQNIYIQKLTELVTRYKTEVKDSVLLSQLNTYIYQFKLLVQIDKSIGLSNSDGLRVKIAEDNHNLLRLTDKLNKEITQYFRAKLTIYRIAYITLSVFLILAALYLSIIMSRKFSMRIVALSKHIETYVESNFTSKRTLFIKAGNDEIGSLIRNYGILKDKLSLHLRNLEYEVAKRTKTLKEQNQDILAGINYAKNIQDALLPSIQNIERHLPNYFVFFRPKAIVSGDFYWYKYLPKGKKSVIAVADCTGHGVPGAFMSMLGIALLNDVVLRKNIKTTGETLDELRKQVVRNLFRNDESKLLADGMDIALIAIDHVENTLQFSGANRPMVLIQNNDCQIIKGDKMPIGKYLGGKSDFQTHFFNLKEGDKIYMFTDGFADQFGGADNKKFMKSRLFELIKSISMSVPNSLTENVLRSEFETWKGDNEQTDDVLVLGLQYSERLSEKSNLLYMLNTV